MTVANNDDQHSGCCGERCSRTQNDGGPAFARTGYTAVNLNQDWPNDGMSLRDYFAAQAMAALLNYETSAIYKADPDGWMKAAAELAYVAADAMIAERDK